VKENLKGLPVDELETRLAADGHPPFRGRQLFRWIYQVREHDFAQMTDLSKGFRAELTTKFELPRLEVASADASTDGTVKYLVRLPDGERVESVFIPTEDRNTLCVSTQVGCKMGCTFCATAYQGFTRNLKAWEIVDQLISVPTPAPVTNIVLMGMGEPLDNFDEVIRALKIFQDPMGPKIGKKHITLSTVGLTPKIQKFVDTNLGHLAISLHGTTDEQRATIMPVNRKYPIANLMDTCRNLKFKGKKRVTFEYLLIKDFNDSVEDARRLVKLVSGFPSKINLLAYNENPYIHFKRPDESRVLAFQAVLLDKGLTATFRRSRGRDIAAACGQLRIQEKVAARDPVHVRRVAATAASVPA
jgi:23S rRNA (adenine2503-C2)-methyltransferase